MSLKLGEIKKRDVIADSIQNSNDNEGLATKVRSVEMFQTFTRHKKMRLISEAALEPVAPFHLTPGVTYHFITAGDIDELTFIRHMVRDQHVKYMLVSTWCMTKDDAKELYQWVARGDVDRVDFYVGKFFKTGYRGCKKEMFNIVELCGGRVARFNNHAKVCVVYGDRYNAVLESSANINTNPRTEQTAITCEEGSELSDFYKSFFDGIKDFDGNYESWKPWEEVSSPQSSQNKT